MSFLWLKRHELSPLLLRIDSFMQTRLLRNIFAQHTGIDFAQLVAEKKLVLINLSVGLIGFENSKFLAKLIITKLNQIAFARQSISKEHRHPIHLYIDEANNYAQSIVIEQILSGSRKYGLSLSLVLQHLEQVHTQMLNSILSNTGTQIFFRQSDKDAKRIAPSFSFFESEDFMNLARGEALVKVNTRNNDFNITTFKGKEPNVDINIKEDIIEQSRKKYGIPLAEIDEIIRRAFSFKEIQKTKKSEQAKPKTQKEISKTKPNIEISKEQKSLKEIEVSPISQKSLTNKKKEEVIKQEMKKEQLRKHRSLQNRVRTIAHQQGFKAIIEEEINKGKRVDVGLHKDNIRIAVEISVSNTTQYEVNNIQKCIDAKYTVICMLSDNEKHLNEIKKRALKEIDKKQHSKIVFVNSDNFPAFLETFTPKSTSTKTRVKGYRVTTNYETKSPPNTKLSSLSNIVIKSLKKKS